MRLAGMVAFGNCVRLPAAPLAGSKRRKVGNVAATSLKSPFLIFMEGTV